MATIKPLENGKWQVRWRDELNKQKKFTGTKTKAHLLFKNLSAREIMQKSGLHNPKGIKDENMKNWTVKDLGERYIEEYLINTAAKGNKSYVKTIMSKWHNWRLTQINVEHIRPWIYAYLNGKVGDKKWEVSSVKKLVAYFKRMFTWGCEMGYISDNPLKYVLTSDLKKKLQKVNKRDLVIDHEDFWALEKKLPLFLRNFCICIWSTGMRVGEVAELKWKHVDFKKRLFRLDRERTKEGDYKKIGINNELFDILIILKETQRSNNEDYIFLSHRGFHIDKSTICKKFRKVADEANFHGLRMHDFRHCWTTHKRKAGHDKSVIKANVGHSSDSMFDWYNKVDEEEIQELAGITSDIFIDLENDIEELVRKAIESKISLATFQGYIAKLWKKTYIK